MYDRILIPTDGSEVAERAGRVGIAMATRFDAELSVISVADPGDDHDERRAVEAIADAAESAGFDPTTDVIEDGRSVHRAIIEYAEENGADAIVIGTHGRTGMNRFLLGSVAEQTLRESSIPVVTVHEDTDVEFDIENVLVPTDGSDSAEAAAEQAIELAKRTGATLHALFVTDAAKPADGTPADALKERAEEAGLDDVVAATRRGRPHQAIGGYAAEAEIDCILMGTHGRTGLRRYLLGSVTERTVRFAPVPVISVKPARDATSVEYLDYEVLEERGWSLDDGDLFEKANAAEADLDEEAYGTIEVNRGEYILEAAEAEGYDWPFRCRGGACVNCAAVLVAGEVEMEVHRSLSEEEIEEKNIRLTCVATPKTDTVKLVYNAKNLDFLRQRVI